MSLFGEIFGPDSEEIAAMHGQQPRAPSMPPMRIERYRAVFLTREEAVQQLNAFARDGWNFRAWLDDRWMAAVPSLVMNPDQRRALLVRSELAT
jgi:hypothetical protein